MEKIKYSVYRYASETFGCSVNGKRLYLDAGTRSTFGVMAISGQKKELMDEIKRIIRKRRRQRRKVTIGFYKAKGTDFMFTRDLWAYDDNLQDKLRIYKLWKEYVLSRNCDLATHTITSGMFIPNGEKTKITTKESSDIVDVTRPIKIKFNYEEEII